MTLSRRQAMSSSAAAAIGVAGAANPVRAAPAAAESTGPNDRRLMELHAEWQRLMAKRRELSEREVAIRAAMPADTHHPADDIEAIVAAKDRGVDGVTLARMRDRAWEHRKQWFADFEARGGDELHDEDEAIGGALIDVEHAIGDIPPDTVAGLRVYLDILIENYPSDGTVATDEPWRHAFSLTPESMIANMVAFMRRTAGADGAG